MQEEGSAFKIKKKQEAPTEPKNETLFTINT